MTGHDIIVIGASAGGIEALQDVVAGLPADLPAAVFIVWHMPAYAEGLLPHVLSRTSLLPVANAQDGEPIVQGRIYVAPPDYHLLLTADRVRLTHGPKENRFRPAVDPLFRSAATIFGSRVIGVVLSGALDDGTAGLWAIKDHGGITVIQEPLDAQFSSMPLSALDQVAIDHRSSARQLGPLLAQLAREPAHMEGERRMAEDADIENQIAMADTALEKGVMTLGTPSVYSCPECHGVLLQLRGGPPVRFRCHTGHAYTVAALSASISEAIEANLWSTARVLEEQLLLLRQMVQQGTEGSTGDAVTQIASVEQKLQLIRLAVLDQPLRVAGQKT